MLKRILSIALALTLVLSTAVVSLAASYDYGTIFSGVVSPDRTKLPSELEVGSTNQFELFRYDETGKKVGDPGTNTNVGVVTSTVNSRYKLTTSVSTGKSYATASIIKKSGKYYLEVVAKETTSKIDRDFTVAIVSRENGGKRRYNTEEFDFTIIADANKVGDSISSYDEEYDISEGKRVTLECDDNITKCRLNIGPSTYVDLKARKGDILTFKLEYDDEDDDVVDESPYDSTLTFYNFTTSPTFRQTVKAGLYADEGQKYVYSIDSNSKLTSISATMRDDYLTFSTKKLGYYVISDRKLSSSGSTSSSSSSSSDTYYEDTSSSTESTSSGSVGYDTIKQAFSSVGSGSTAVLLINNGDTINLADLKAVAKSYPNRGLCVRHKNGSQTTYQYTFSAAQIPTLKDSNSDGELSLGMSATASNTLGVFTKYYKNSFLSLEHYNKGAMGANVSYAVHIGGTSISRKNLKIYWYDASRNYYELCKTTPKVDSNSFLYFTAPAGYDIVVSDGIIAKK